MAGSLVALGLLAAACGSGNDAEDTGDATASAANDEGATPAAGATTAPVGNSEKGGDFCAVFREELDGLGKAFPKDLEAPDQLKAYGDFAKASNARVLAAAPDDIRGALEIQTRSTSALVESFRNGVSPPPEALKELQSPEFLAASKQVGEYGKDKCGLDPSSVPSG